MILAEAIADGLTTVDEINNRTASTSAITLSRPRTGRMCPQPRLSSTIPHCRSLHCTHPRSQPTAKIGSTAKRQRPAPFPPQAVVILKNWMFEVRSPPPRPRPLCVKQLRLTSYLYLIHCPLLITTQHFTHPYPNEVHKIALCSATGLTKDQV